MRGALPTRGEFLLQATLLTSVVSVAGVALIALYLTALLRFTPEQWAAFLRATGAGFVVCFAAVASVNRALQAPVLELLARGVGDAAGERRAYRRVTQLPRVSAITGNAYWVIGGAGVGLATRLQAPSFAWESVGILVAAAGSGGLVAMIFYYFLQQRQLAPLRIALAERLREPDLRESLMARVGLRVKLLVAVGGVTFVVVAFTLLLAHVTARRPLAGALDASRRALSEELAAAGAPDAGLAARVAQRATELVDQQAAAELHARRAVSLGVLLLGTLLAVGVAVLVARDVDDKVSALSRDVARVAAGDLRAQIGFEGEDELGTLARAFESMIAALRGTVGSVASAADEVEAASERLADVAGDLAAATSEQVAGIRHAAGSMESIRQQVDEITGSSETLSRSVDESSGSLAELGTAGEQLHSTATVLNEKVDTVSSSIDRMIDSVRRVVESADDLSNAAEETASGLDEMAATVESVDQNAADTAHLSQRVIEVAERGRERVQETIEGMEGIRTATDVAQNVIAGLAQRVAAIGTILGVIDDVADETNLLALNAAIIAAQAGDQGRAFSVVADEIKELADRVLENTQEIGALIRSVQEESRSAAQAMEKGAERVQGGVSLAAEAGVALEEITHAARQSGDHIRGIVGSVKEQVTASGHIIALMDRVRTRVDQIRKAGLQHERGNEVVRRGAQAMREMAQQVTSTTREQARGTGGLARSVELVKDAVAEIHHALQQQSGSSGEAATFLEQVHERTRSHEEAATTLADATAVLLQQAHGLRESIRRFSI